MLVIQQRHGTGSLIWYQNLGFWPWYKKCYVWWKTNTTHCAENTSAQWIMVEVASCCGNASAGTGKLVSVEGKIDGASPRRISVPVYKRLETGNWDWGSSSNKTMALIILPQLHWSGSKTTTWMCNAGSVKAQTSTRLRICAKTWKFVITSGLHPIWQ